MEETFYTGAIILKRSPWRENDSKVIVYSLEKGKLELVARGTKKILSKLASHLEPITLSDLMVIKGRQVNYVGTAISEESFQSIKGSLEEIFLVGETINLFNSLVKEQEPDPQLFYLLRDFLFLVNDNEEAELFDVAFKIKLIEILGYSPNFNSCIICGQNNAKQSFIFDFVKGGIVCEQCKAHISKNIQTLNLALVDNYKKISSLEIKNIASPHLPETDREKLKKFLSNYILANIK